ncbi:MAG: DUF2237 family protein [Cellvibrionaceae bacterium]
MTKNNNVTSFAKNILGTPLENCCSDPITGFFRDGYCNTNQQDTGRHLVCVIVTDEFLEFSYKRGNDLITPRPEYGFPGLKSGDGWCLCADRWFEAYKENAAPSVNLLATHEKALDIIPLDALKKYAINH